MHGRRLLMASPAPSGGAPYADEVDADSPVHWYRMDEVSGSLADSGSGSQTGSVVGSLTYGQTGAITGNDAVAFDDAYSYVNLSTSWQYASNLPYSAEFWIKMGTHGTTRYLLTNIVASGVQIDIDSAGKLQCYIFGATGYAAVESSSDPGIRDDEYHHIVMTYDGTESPDGIKFYVDGVDTSLTTLSDTLTVTGSPDATNTRINYPNSFGEFGIVGDYDEVALYDTELSAVRVAAHFNANDIA